MEEETLASSEVPVAKVVEEMANNVDPNKVKEVDESTFEGEFIQVEKESVVDGKPCANEQSSSNSYPSREILESQEKVKELELQLLAVSGALKHSESENIMLNNKVFLTKEKLEESGKQYDELELSHKKLQDQIYDSEERYNVQLNTLQEVLQAQEIKQRELIGVKEAFDGLNLELESSKKKMLEVEQELHFSTGEALKFKELHKQSGFHAEFEAKKALEFERLLEMAKLSAKEVEAQMAILQEEVEGLYAKIAENEKVEAALKVRNAELSIVQGELEISKSQVVVIEKRLNLKEDLIKEFSEKIYELSSTLEKVEEEKKQLRVKMQEHETVTKDSELKLQEAIASFTSRDFEVKSLYEKVQALEDQVMIFKEQTSEAAERYASLRDEFDIISLKLAFSENANEELKKWILEAEDKAAQSLSESELLVETNTQLKSKINELQELLNSEYVEKEATSQQLTQGLAVYESKVNDLQTKLFSTYSVKDEAVEQLHASKTEVEDLKQQLNFDRQRFKSQKELQTMELEGQLKEQKSNENALKAEIENLKAEIEKKSELNDRLKKFEEQLAARDALVNVEDTGAGSNELQEGMEVKYRETGSPISTPSKRRHKKKLEGTCARSSSSSDTQTQNNEVSSGMTFKFILGVALVSVIVGVVLGKKY